jgi:hypothetical protein
MIVLAVAAAVPPSILFALLVSMPVSRLRHAEAIDAPSSNKSAAPAKRVEAPARSRAQNIPLLRLEEAYWQSRLELSKKESIGLAVDLVDSTANVEIRGVPVRKCKIRRYEIGNGIKHLQNQSRFLTKMSKPLMIQSETATLLKEPIRIEQAPKDSIEAIKAAARPFKPEIVDVYFTLSFGDDLVLVVKQLEKPSSKQASREIARLRMKRNLGQAGQALRALAHMNLPRHEHRIEITLTREDAKALYRALSKDTGCVFRL